MDEAKSWPDLEAALHRLPSRTAARFAVRCAIRLFPNVPRLAEDFGPEASEWAGAIAEVIRTVEAFSRGESVSRFTLDLAAEVARCAATATANAAKLLGHSPLMEPAELAYAAAAFAADSARASSPERGASLAVRAAKMEANGREPTRDHIADAGALIQGEPLTTLELPSNANGTLRLMTRHG